MGGYNKHSTWELLSPRPTRLTLVHVTVNVIMYDEKASNEQLYLNWACQCMLNFSPCPCSCTLHGKCLRSRDHFVKPLPCHVTWHLVYPLFRYRIQNRPDSEIASRNANALAPNAKSNLSIIDAETDYFASRHCWGLNFEVVSYAGVTTAKSSRNSGAGPRFIPILI